MLRSVFRVVTLAWPAVMFLAGSSTAERMVTINLVAVDSHGDPVPHLHAEDIAVFDAGKKREIVFLHRLGSEPWNPPPLGPNQVDNRGGSFAPYATAVVLDLLSEGFSAQANASNRLVHDLQGIADPSSVFLYLLSVEGRLIPVNGIPFELHFHYHARPRVRPGRPICETSCTRRSPKRWVPASRLSPFQST